MKRHSFISVRGELFIFSRWKLNNEGHMDESTKEIAKKGCIRCSFEAHERKEVVKAMIEPKSDRQGMGS